MSEVNGVLVAAHDLKAPLGTLRQLALSFPYATTDVERAHIQSQMVAVADRALKQVNDLAKIARLSDAPCELEPVSVRAVCDEVCRELDPAFRSENRSLHLLFRNRSRLALANRDLLHSVVYNLCTNALRYSDRSTASLLTISEPGGCLRIGVRDFGPALPDAVWRSLRSGGLSSPTSVPMRPGGSGLGLYVASAFARSMHASLGAIRHRDGVSLFVDLPISKQTTLFPETPTL